MISHLPPSSIPCRVFPYPSARFLLFLRLLIYTVQLLFYPHDNLSKAESHPLITAAAPQLRRPCSPLLVPGHPHLCKQFTWLETTTSIHCLRFP
ncbi:hypothetical protein B0H65DRAFT_449824 [Neurospora tetraspora]|uniref:Uncharacterized protein n=1 Tax=Neurospora tetraspora TaxID=94610 RepID=A0AAE0MX86_9PEZI|nr:hypothetical protein B0H65DRAFT_449824 [Neurospora tetraspora]